jgi:hypothetical protein
MRLLALTAMFFGFCATNPVANATDAPSACAMLAGLIPIEGGPLFLPSYPTAQPGPLRSVAFLYDDSVAAIALAGCGEAGRARRIGDAILAALNGDRFWHDGRLRNAYAAGPVRESPVKLGGWWDAAQNRWLEDAYQVGSDSGNMAWAMLALLALDRAYPDAPYRAGAIRIGAWLAGRADSRGAGGFTGGFSGWEPKPAENTWKSTEHNTDIAAAFTLLFQATADPVWAARAKAAGDFVASMWDQDRACFDVGTGEDGVTPNRIVALDAQIWPLLALPGMAAAHGNDVLPMADRVLGAVAGDFHGYSYSDAAHGFWTEGTAQAALYDGLSGLDADAAQLNDAVAAERAPGGGYFATADNTLATGFADATNPGQQRLYYRLPHLAAMAWAALAERKFNPFIAASVLPP